MNMLIKTKERNNVDWTNVGRWEGLTSTKITVMGGGGGDKRRQGGQMSAGTEKSKKN